MNRINEDALPTEVGNFKENFTEFETPLVAAVRSHNRDVVKSLIKSGVDVNSSMSIHSNTGGGATAMYYAAADNLFGIANLLYYAGASVRIPNGRAVAPYDIARENNHNTMAAWLSEMSYLEDAKNKSDGVSPSYYVPNFDSKVGKYYS